MVQNYLDKSKCCGCEACKAICPKKAISMEEDEKGFAYPKINKDVCIDCGQCVEVCNFRKFNAFNGEPLAFAARHKNKKEIESSRSGAIFIALSDYVLNKGGAVCGCELLKDNTVVHSIKFNKNEVDKFKGSKYVQSNMNSVFPQCENILKEGKWLLFSGTGCQVHGLISYLGLRKINREKLITLDIVCHGVPSPKVWKNYVDAISKKEKDTLINVNFRDKSIFGWKEHKESYTFKNGKIKTSNDWARVYYSHNMFRDCCYECPYTTPSRMSDFTVADCWGIEKVAPRFNDDKGVSLLIVQSERAFKIFKEVSNCIDFDAIDLKLVLQPQLIHPVQKGAHFDKFWSDYSEDSKRCINKYFLRKPIKLRIIDGLRFFKNCFFKR